MKRSLLNLVSYSFPLPVKFVQDSVKFTHNKCVNSRKMSLVFEASVETKKMLRVARLIVPELNDSRHKGQAGRIGVIGGCTEYTGAPYFAAISALKVGADLVHVFCHRGAGSVIKAYSPELIVHPVLDSEDAVREFEKWLQRLHVVVIGPGLGREDGTLNTVANLIELCKKNNKPIVIDADGLYLISKRMELIKDYNNTILTPNANEFKVLFGETPEEVSKNMKLLGNGITILEKGTCDKIHISNTLEVYQLASGGSGRRCGGQGDLLSGSLATFFHWALESNQPNPAYISAFAASFLTKKCNSYAYSKFGRSMLASDMINEIHAVFEEFFEVLDI